MKVFRENRKEAKMDVTDSELIIKETAKATKYKILSGIKDFYQTGKSETETNLIDSIITYIENLEV